MKLIKLQDKFILVSEEEISQDDKIIRLSNLEISIANDEWNNDSHEDWKKIISENPDFSLLSEEDCKRIGWVDVKKSAEHEIPYKHMKIEIGSKVKHIPSGDIVIVKSKTKIFIRGIIKDHEQDWLCDKPTKVRFTECESYIEPPKEKSFYDKMRERNMEDAKALPTSPKTIDQHLLYLKMAVIDRIEKIENRTGDEIYTFRKGKLEDPDNKFGFSEHYVNLLMHYAYESGKKNATDSLTRHFNESTKNMKNAIETIVHALDTNDLLPENENY